MKKFWYTLLFAGVFVLLHGCVSVLDINEGFRKIDRTWQLENQRTEDEFRYRVVESDYDTTYLAVRRTFIDLGMPVQSSSSKKGLLFAQNNAPAPLTKEEWADVVKVEQPRIKEIGGWMFTMNDDPSTYVVTVMAYLRPFKGGTFVLLDYELDAPKYKAMGFKPAQQAPPLAVKIASIKFWNQLSKRLEQIKVPEPRRRKPNEHVI